MDGTTQEPPESGCIQDFLSLVMSHKLPRSLAFHAGRKVVLRKSINSELRFNKTSQLEPILARHVQSLAFQNTKYDTIDCHRLCRISFGGSGHILPGSSPFSLDHCSHTIAVE